MKKVIVSTILVGLSLTATSVFAEEGQIQPVAIAMPLTASVTSQALTDVAVPVVPEISTVAPVTEKAEIIKTTSLEKMKSRGLQLINERIKSLNSNAQAIASSKSLTTEQKSAFATFFTIKISDLNALSAKIASSTEPSSTKSLISSVFTEHRIYGVLIPQLRLEKRLYELQNHAAKLTETFVKVQTNIDAYKAKGKDVTVWQKSLDDAKLVVASDTQKLPILLVQINALKPIDYGTTSKATIESVNKSVKAIAYDFQGIAKKVRRPELHLMKRIMTASSTSPLR